MKLTTATPAQIDAELARIGQEIAVLERKVERDDYVIERYTDAYYAERRKQAIAERAAHLAKIAELEAERAPLNAEFDRRGGWSRYYLVDNANGHIHPNTLAWSCSRTNTTSYLWLTETSGMSQEELVEAAGEKACTTCFPWAPAEALNRPSQFKTTKEAERAEREQAKQAKLQEKIAKGVTPDGSPLVVKVLYTHEIKTERAAELRLVEFAAALPRQRNLLRNLTHSIQEDAAGNVAWANKAVERAEEEIFELDTAVTKISEALAWKRGTTAAEEIAKLQAKIDKKIRQGY